MFRQLPFLLLPCLLFAAAEVSAERAPLGIDAITICMNFGCKQQQTVAIKPAEWDGAANWFGVPASTAAAERMQIKQAVGWMEVIIGRYTPTHKDFGGNFRAGASFLGQLDCIDESLNTTTYLKLFALNGLLKHHKVIDRAYRQGFFDQHWAGQIEELKSGERWVVDSWFQPNGKLPYVGQSKLWKTLSLFASY